MADAQRRRGDFARAACTLAVSSLALGPVPDDVRADGPDGDRPGGSGAAHDGAPRRTTTDEPLSGVERTVFVRRFDISGATRWTPETLRRLLAGFEGRRLDAETLERARRLITRWYVDHGHLNSGALLPDQRVIDGVVRIEVVEGRLDTIEITGNRALDARYFIDRLRAVAAVPVDLNRLHDRLQRLQELALVERVQARFEPGDGRGSGRLRVHVSEASPWQAGVVVANDRAPGVGAIRTQVTGAHRSLSGRGDAFGLRYGLARGLDDWGVDYALPLTPDDVTLTLRADASDAQVVESPFSALDIRSRTRSTAVGIAWPLRVDSVRGRTIGLMLERKRSETALLGEPFSFSPGVQNGRSVVTVLRVSLDETWRSATEAIAARVVLNRGLDAAGATVSAIGEPDGRFVSAQAQLQWARRLDERGTQVFARADLQWSRDPLLPLEKLAVGGAGSVRGYRENLLVRDQGLVISAEYRLPITRIAIGDQGPLRDAMLQFAPFVDYGTTANRDAPTPAPRWLGSVGLALRASIGRHVSAELHYGRALNRPAGRGNDLQDRGLHFRLVLRTD